MRAMAAAGVWVLGALSALGQERIEGEPYEKLETRAATRERMIRLLAPQRAQWASGT